MMTASELARALGYTKGRISQLVSDGRLKGAFVGVGRERRFDLDKAAALLNIRLDHSQQTGNGIRQMELRARLGDAPEPIQSAQGDSDAQRLARARADAAEVAARQKRREEQMSTGRYVLAEAAARATQAAVAETIAAAERLLVDEAKRLAVAHGENPREAAADMRSRWRAHRAAQAQAFAALADEAAADAAELREMADA